MNNPELVHTGILDLIGQAGFIVKLVLLILAVASIFCWAVILTKYRAIKVALRQNFLFNQLFWKSKSLDEVSEKAEDYSYSPIASVFKAGFKELQKLGGISRSDATNLEVDNIHRSLMRASNTQMAALERYVTLLATTASAAPFVGLFGTVWGIMNSFQNIGATGAANLAVVAPGISEALIATAVGLAAAIPAAVAYNHFASQIRRIALDMEGFSQDFLNIVQRGLLGERKAK